MQSSWKFLITLVAISLAAPSLAIADEVEEQLRQMQQRMNELENKLQATNDELESSKERVEKQEELIQKAGIDEVRGAGSGSPAMDFVNSIEFDGFVAASWNYNFNGVSSGNIAQGDLDPDDDGFPPSTVNGENQGRLGLTAPGFTNTNSFQLDQLWIGFGKTPTMESNAGFRADIVYGALADANREGTFFTTDEDDSDASDFGTGDLPHIYQAYAEYLAPVGENGISFKAGRFATPIGAEPFRQDQSWQITRGITWVLQPVNHTGLLVSGKCSRCGMDWLIGAVNSYSDTMSDRDNDKGVLGGLKFSRETWSLASNVFWGGDSGDWTPWARVSGVSNSGIMRESDKIGVLDHVLSWNPTDNLSTWINYDYYWTNNSNSSLGPLNIHAIALASRYAITDRAGVALRGEYQMWDTSGDAFGGGDASSNIHMWALTGTVDYALTENMIVKVEGRYDIGTINNSPDDFFMGGTGSFSDSDDALTQNDQFLALVQMMYKF
jgi:Putative beta-barrel porin-2, OmpL-like. bbp2